ncbi:hypothetical protein F3D3_1792 [Fusibacter sp. 3D3]|nr:hypothetical protein F3D3_1792 [Fusibacter sp. 3D3]
MLHKIYKVTMIISVIHPERRGGIPLTIKTIIKTKVIP